MNDAKSFLVTMGDRFDRRTFGYTRDPVGFLSSRLVDGELGDAQLPHVQVFELGLEQQVDLPQIKARAEQVHLAEAARLNPSALYKRVCKGKVSATEVAALRALLVERYPEEDFTAWPGRPSL